MANTKSGIRKKAAPPQCRFKVKSGQVLAAYRATAKKYGYEVFTHFMLDLMEAAQRGDPKTRLIELPLPGTAVTFEQRLAS